jgi:predicted NBD/HSP70 family sugar kinase
MDLAIDIGGSKTLLAVFSPEGEVLAKHKIATAKNYQTFLKELEQTIKKDLQDYKFHYCCCAVPGLLDRKQGIAIAFGNLSWQNIPILQDISKIVEGSKVAIENDSKLAALSEAILVQKRYKKVLYLTIGTGIGDGLVINGKLDEGMLDSEAGQMVLEHDGKLKQWEDIVSGRAIVKRFGKRAAELDDPAIWATYSRDLALGLEQLLAVVEPEVLIIGGGVGAHFDKFGHYLKDELKKLENDMVKIPPVLAAKRPEEAVIYGCYEYIKQQH